MNTTDFESKLNPLNRERLQQMRAVDRSLKLTSWQAIVASPTSRSGFGVRTMSVAQTTRWATSGDTVCAVAPDGKRFRLGHPEGRDANEAVLAYWRTMRAYDLLAVTVGRPGTGTHCQVFRRLPGVASGWALWSYCKIADLPKVASPAHG